MTEEEFKASTKAPVLKIIPFYGELPRNQANDVMSRQLICSASSAGANYRAACRAKSTADTIAKLAIVKEEADKTLYWLELLSEQKSVNKNATYTLLKQSESIL